jgi:hypothetical protein
LLALKPTLKTPAATGSPEITPEVALTESPSGKPEAPNAVGLFVAVI